MKTLLLALTLLSVNTVIASERISLEDAMRAVQNDVDTKAVAKAITCAQTGTHCGGSTWNEMVDGLSSLSATNGLYALEIGILKEALLATEIYEESELQIIQDAIKLLEEKN